MKIGFKTRIWGRKLDNIANVLDIIASAGFQGVEFSQRPEDLGVRSGAELKRLMTERDLKFLSLTHGSLLERSEFCKDYNPHYTYVSHWDVAQIPELVKRGFSPVVHPGMFSPIRRLEDAKPLLEKYPELGLICDTAHLAILGEHPHKCARLFQERTLAVHFQDWTAEFGRSGSRYERGFTELGEGDVQLDATLAELRKVHFAGWLIVEIGSVVTDPLRSVRLSTNWLSERQLLRRTGDHQVLRTVASSKKSMLEGNAISPEAEAEFRKRVMLASVGNPVHFYKEIACAFHELIHSKAVLVWTFSPSQDQIGLMASEGCAAEKTLEGAIFSPHKLLAGIAVDRQDVATRFDLTEADAGVDYGYFERGYPWQEELHSLGITEVLTIPLYSFPRYNYPRIIIDILNAINTIDSSDQLASLKEAVIVAADTMLDRLCTTAMARVNLLTSECDNSEKYLLGLRDLIKRRLNCDGVAIFLVDEAENKLVLGTTTGTIWMVPRTDEFYAKGEGLTGNVWAKRETVLTVDSRQESGHVGKSSEIVEKSENHACLLMSMIDSDNKVVGVVRCRSKHSFPSMFTEDDAAILDAIGQVAVPHLGVLLNKERTSRALARLTHELKKPLVAIRGACDMMEKKRSELEQLYPYDYLGDILSWSNLMHRLLNNADNYQVASATLPIRATTPIKLMADVIAPAVNQVDLLLREKGFSKYRIEYGRFQQVPPLFIDQNQFQQVLFNLLSNAIKHSFIDPNAFRVEIDGEAVPQGYRIHFRDYGPGIPPGMEDLIFTEGFRTPEARQRDVSGQGLGLWVVRQIVEAHGGLVGVTNFRFPTQFTIELPRQLSIRGPRS